MSNAEKIKLIVYVNLILLGLATLYVIYRSVDLEKQLHQKQNLTEDQRTLKQEIIYLLVTWAFVLGITATINIILLKGVTQRNHTKCMVWFGIYSLGTTIQIYKIVMSFVQGHYGEGVYLLIWAFISLYALYVVSCFMNELKQDSSMQLLTNKD